MKTQKRILSIVFLIIFTSVFAHGIWVEVKNNGAVGKETTVHLYFGEMNHNLREKGLTWYEGDMFSNFKAFVKPQGSSKSEALNLNASETSLSTSFTPIQVGIHQIVAFNEDSPVRDVTKHGLGMLKDSIYLRTTFEATSRREKQEGTINLSPMMKYDIVPYPAKNGYGEYDSHKSSWRVNEKVFATFFINYKPAINKEVKIVSPDGWSVIKTTNKKGEFNFEPYIVGNYQAIYQKKDKVDGVYKGKNFDTARIKVITTLSVE